MTDLVGRSDSWPAYEVADPPARRMNQCERMREWLWLFKECREAAEILSRTSFVPKEMQGKPAEAAVSMMKGWELGLDPLDALANIFVVHGRVGFYAEFQRRRVIQAGHSFRIVESTASRCVVEGTRKDTGETHKAVFTAEQARQAKIDIQAYPAEKLVARATSRLVKQAFPDVLSGSLIVEDLLDGVITTDVDPVTAPAVQRRRQPRKVIAQPAAPPPPADVDDLLGDVQPVAEEMRPDVAEPDQGDLLDDDPDPPITSPQLQKLSILRKREGYADDEKGRADWFAWIELQINRVVSTNKDLTKAEATVLIDVLENPGAEDNPA